MLSNLAKIAIVVCLVIRCKIVFSQSVPDSISYQAVMRDANGDELANEFVTIEFAIRKDSPSGTVVFHEQHDLVSTNEFGLFDCNIGGGTYTGVGLYTTLGQIEWNQGKYFLEVSATIPGEGAPQLVGTSQLLTVPYAFHASTADSVLNESDGSTSNEVLTNIYLNGSNLVFEENTASYSLPIASLAAVGFDNSETNELIENVTVQSDTILSITEGGITDNYDVSDIAFATWQKNSNSVYNMYENVGIGTNNATSTLSVNGSLALSLLMLNTPGTYAIGSDIPANVAVYAADVTAGTITLEMPDAASCPGRVYKFRKKNSGSNNYALNLFSSLNQFEGSASFNLFANLYYVFATIMSTGSQWVVVDYSFYIP